MKQLHSNYVLLVLCLTIVSVVSGYKPLNLTRQGENNTKEIVLDCSLAKHGRSVYDPQIYERYKGLKFHDHIPEKSLEKKDKRPKLPSYPWRGGGHEPLPLDDPDHQLREDEVNEYIMGYKDCKEVLWDQLNDLHEEDRKPISEEENLTENLVSCAQQPDSIHEQSENLTESSSVGLQGVGAVPYVSGALHYHHFLDSHGNINANDVEGETDNEPDTSYENNINDNSNVVCVTENEDNNEGSWSPELTLNVENGEHDVADHPAIEEENNFFEEEDTRVVFSPLKDTSADGDVEGDFDEDDDEGTEGERDHMQLNAFACRVCLPCCEYFIQRAAMRPTTVPGGAHGECATDSEGDFLSTECRTCHVRRRLPQFGVVLTCYDCAQQQADSTCRLGVYNAETSQYRVSAKFFVVTESNDTSEVPATQHSSMVDKRIIPQYEFPILDSTGRPQYQPVQTFFADGPELYPFETEDDDEKETEGEAEKENEEQDNSTENNWQEEENTQKKKKNDKKSQKSNKRKKDEENDS